MSHRINTPSASMIEHIAQMIDSGMSAQEVAGLLAEREIESAAADWEDDSDEAIERRYMISADDTFDSRGEPLRPRIDPESGEPWWF